MGENTLHTSPASTFPLRVEHRDSYLCQAICDQLDCEIYTIASQFLVSLREWPRAKVTGLRPVFVINRVAWMLPLVLLVERQSCQAVCSQTRMTMTNDDRTYRSSEAHNFYSIQIAQQHNKSVLSTQNLHISIPAVITYTNTMKLSIASLIFVLRWV